MELTFGAKEVTRQDEVTRLFNQADIIRVWTFWTQIVWKNNSTLEIVSLTIDPAFVEVGSFGRIIYPISSINGLVSFLISCFLILHVIFLINLYIVSFPLGLTFLFLFLFYDDKNPCIFFFHLLLSLFGRYLIFWIKRVHLRGKANWHVLLGKIDCSIIRCHCSLPILACSFFCCELDKGYCLGISLM